MTSNIPDYESFVEKRIKILEDEPLNNIADARDVRFFSLNLQKELKGTFHLDQIRSLMKSHHANWKKIGFIFQNWLYRLQKVELIAFKYLTEANTLVFDDEQQVDGDTIMEHELLDKINYYKTEIKEIIEDHDEMRNEIQKYLHNSLSRNASSNDIPDDKKIKEISTSHLLLRSHFLLLQLERDINSLEKQDEFPFDIKEIKLTLDNFKKECVKILRKILQNTVAVERLKHDDITSKDIRTIKKTSNSILRKLLDKRSEYLFNNSKNRTEYLSKMNERKMKQAKIEELKKKLAQLKERNKVYQQSINDAIEKYNNLKIEKEKLEAQNNERLSLIQGKYEKILQLRREFIQLSSYALFIEINTAKEKDHLVSILFTTLKPSINPGRNFLMHLSIYFSMFELYGGMDLPKKESGYKYFESPKTAIPVFHYILKKLNYLVEDEEKEVEFIDEFIKFEKAIQGNFICSTYPIEEEYYQSPINEKLSLTYVDNGVSIIADNLKEYRHKFKSDIRIPSPYLRRSSFIERDIIRR